MSAPDQLWSTDYGRNLAVKVALLVPIMMLVARSRRLVATLADGTAPTAARLRVVARNVKMELAIAAGIITLAALLVAQIPGRA